MKLARAARMHPSDLADRLRQEQRKVLERLRVVSARELEAPPLSLADFRRRIPERFFIGALDDETPRFITAHLPTAREQVVSAAAKTLAGRFDLLGYSDLDFGQPVAWGCDPLSGIRTTPQHWTRIDPLDRSAVGDHKVIWELNRHQWLLHWAQAYAFTGDESYAERSVDALDRWLRANPVGVGVNWVSSLELAMRLVSWSWTLVLLRDSAAMSPEFFARMLGSIHAHATHIEHYLSTTYSPNTHLLGEALGLFYVGVLFAELEQAASWRIVGERILVEQAERQILPDGVCFEQSTCYQRYTIEMYVHFLALAARNGVAVPAAVSARVQRAVDFLLAAKRADGTVPQIGDGDGGWLLPLVPRAGEDMRAVFGIAAALFDRRDYASAAGAPVLEVAWLFGPGALLETSAASTHTPSPVTSQLFPDGGYAVLRADSGRGDHTLLLDVGPLGCPTSAAHGHADLLALTCDIFGTACIVDPGMPTYGGDPAWRDAFRSTRLHSSATVDGLSQAVPSGMFAWQSQPRATLRSWTSNDALDCVDAEHRAYATRCDGLRHRRRVVFVKPRYWVVVDEFEDAGGGVARSIDLNFQFASRHALSIERDWVRVAAPQGHALLVLATASIPLAASVHEGELGGSPIRGWHSPTYGKIQTAPALVYRATTKLPFRTLTFLLPVERGDTPIPASFPPRADAALLERALG